MRLCRIKPLRGWSFTWAKTWRGCVTNILYGYGVNALRIFQKLRITQGCWKSLPTRPLAILRLWGSPRSRIKLYKNEIQKQKQSPFLSLSNNFIASLHLYTSKYLFHRRVLLLFNPFLVIFIHLKFKRQLRKIELNLILAIKLGACYIHRQGKLKSSRRCWKRQPYRAAGEKQSALDGLHCGRNHRPSLFFDYEVVYLQLAQMKTVAGYYNLGGSRRWKLQIFLPGLHWSNKPDENCYWQINCISYDVEVHCFDFL